jgi:hypothetical protein
MAASRVASVGRRASIALAAALTAIVVTMLLAGAVLAAPPGRPAATAPKGAIVSIKPTFTWSKVAGATGYEVRAYNGSALLVRKSGITKVSWRSGKALPAEVNLTWKVRAKNAAGSGAWSKRGTFRIATTIGDAYGGGKIAYFLQPGDPGYVAGQPHGLIAATADQSAGIQWYNGSNVATGATGSALGTGSANTDAIISAQGATATDYAAGLARAYRGGGHTDWYLPSRDELNKLVLNQAAIGGFSTEYYWSSFEFGANYAWYERFSDGSQFYWDKSSVLFRVRAVRSF